MDGPDEGATMNANTRQYDEATQAQVDETTNNETKPADYVWDLRWLREDGINRIEVWRNADHGYTLVCIVERFIGTGWFVTNELISDEQALIDYIRHIEAVEQAERTV